MIAKEVLPKCCAYSLLWFPNFPQLPTAYRVKFNPLSFSSVPETSIISCFSPYSHLPTGSPSHTRLTSCRSPCSSCLPTRLGYVTFSKRTPNLPSAALASFHWKWTSTHICHTYLLPVEYSNSPFHKTSFTSWQRISLIPSNCGYS